MTALEDNHRAVISHRGSSDHADPALTKTFATTRKRLQDEADLCFYVNSWIAIIAVDAVSKRRRRARLVHETNSDDLYSAVCARANRTPEIRIVE